MQNYSVLMSVYSKDSVEYMCLAIDSILSQTVFPEQYVIVKDGPVSEEIEQLIFKYKNDFPDVFTIVSIEENRGLANALNVGLKHCRNELVARMDADDISLPRRCEKLLSEFVKNSDLAVCGCMLDEFYEDVNDVRTSRIVPQEHCDIKKFMRRRQAFNHATVMYRKSIVQEAGGYILLKRKEDFDLFSRIITNGYQTKNIDESLYLCRADENNYFRRKSYLNFKSAIYVYWRHFLRHGCGFFDFIIICMAELSFLVMPLKLMKWVSDNVLRKKCKKVTEKNKV